MRPVNTIFQKTLGDYHQIYNFGELGDKDELIMVMQRSRSRQDQIMVKKVEIMEMCHRRLRVAFYLVLCCCIS